jgi:superfamily II DNA/RNA helicase
MAYTIKRDVKPKRNAGGSGEFRKRSFSGSSRNSKKVDTRPGADRSERSYSDRPRSDRSEGGFKKREYSGAGSSYGTRPRTSEGSSERPRFGGSKFSRGPKTFGSRSGGSRGPSSNSRSGGRSGGRGPKGENIDASRFISRAESVTGVKEEVVKIDHKFADFALDAKLKEAIEKKGYITPTPIQDKTIPFILKGKDVVGLANTGSGKTAAFLLPLITKARLIPEEKVLILAPTRELAIQIADELKDFTSNQYMPFACCVGGMHIGKQIDQLRRPNNFVIGTPGRVKDLIQRKMIDTSKFGTIVLDEADRMLDMGFIDDMKWILSGFPKERQTLFFSATLSPAIEKLIHDFLKTPEHVSVRKRETSKNIDQDVIRVSRNEDKVQVLCKTLRAENCEKVIIFGRTKRGVETLSNNLAREGFKADSIHGDKNHSQRQRALKAFKEGRVDILVATDVAARGLDIPNVTHVINFETPQTYDDYVHRIGRTGRGDATGKAYTFVEHRG